MSIARLTIGSIQTRQRDKMIAPENSSDGHMTSTTSSIIASQLL